MSYNLTCEIETAQAECAVKASQETNILPLKPESPDDTVFTHYWVDNFDVTVEKMSGGGSINTTHLVAYQENSNNCVTSESRINIPRKKGRKLFHEDVNIHQKPVGKKPEPEGSMDTPVNFKELKMKFNDMYLLWLYIRKLNCFNQFVPAFKGWTLQIRSSDEVEFVKTAEVYLPPITTKVTEFSTIQKYLSYLQDLSNSVNMPFVNVTLDVGAAINAYKTVWTYPEEYKNVIIHLGCFHFLKENFQVYINDFNFKF